MDLTDSVSPNDVQGWLDTLIAHGEKRVDRNEARKATDALEPVLAGVFSVDRCPRLGEGFAWARCPQYIDGYGPLWGFCWSLECAAFPAFEYYGRSPFRAGAWLQHVGEEWHWEVSVRVFSTSEDRKLADRFALDLCERAWAAGAEVQFLPSRRVGDVVTAASIVVGLLPPSYPGWLAHFSRLSRELRSMLHAVFRDAADLMAFEAFARRYGVREPDPNACPTCGGWRWPPDDADT